MISTRSSKVCGVRLGLGVTLHPTLVTPPLALLSSSNLACHATRCFYCSTQILYLQATLFTGLSRASFLPDTTGMSCSRRLLTCLLSDINHAQVLTEHQGLRFEDATNKPDDSFQLPVCVDESGIYRTCVLPNHIKRILAKFVGALGHV